MQAKRIDHLLPTVADIERTVEFYRRVPASLIVFCSDPGTADGYPWWP